jgi:glycosyltransferase involved in cell wall biosynthesis
MQKVIFIQRCFAVYRKPIFDILSQSVSFKLLFSSLSLGITNISSAYSSTIPSVKYSTGVTSLLMFPFYQILKIRPKVVVHELAVGILTLPITILFCRFLSIRILLHGHAYDRKLGFNPSKSWKDKYRLLLIKLSNGVILYHENEIGKFAPYVGKHKLFFANNTLDTNNFGQIREDILRSSNFSINPNILKLTFLGRLLFEKQPEKIISIANVLEKVYNVSVEVCYLGGGEAKSKIVSEIEKHNFKGFVKFYDEIFDDYIIGNELLSSNFMICLGALGLSINHSFCFDCPVIGIKSEEGQEPFHGPEINYLKHGINGFLFNEFDPEEIAKKIYQFSNDSIFRNIFTKNIRDTVLNEMPVESMINSILNALNYEEN